MTMVDLPPVHQPRRKYRFEEMEVGEFQFLPGAKGPSVSAYVCRATKKMNRVFRTRTCHAILHTDGSWEIVRQSTPFTQLGVAVWRMS